MARRYLTSLFALFVAFNAVYAGQTGNVYGLVLDKDKQPLVGARVKVLGTTIGALSKEGGKYSLSKINAGTYKIMVTYVGLDTIIRQVNISADETQKQDFVLENNKKTGPIVEVFGIKEIKATDIGSSRDLKGADITKMGKNSVAEALNTQAGIQTSGSGFQIRGGRVTETQVNVDGLTVSDNIVGGMGNVAAALSSAMPSALATEQVQTATGGFGAEYGNATAGVVNQVIKTGKTDSYDGIVQWRRDVPFLFGKAKNGTQLMAPISDVVDGTFGGPLGFNNSTFFVSVRNTFENYRNYGLGVIDPAGNNIGELPNGRTWSRNLLGRIKIQITDNDILLLGTTYGTGSYERSSWAWLYANAQGVATNQFGDPILDQNGNIQQNGVPERVAKQAAIQEFTLNSFAQLSHISSDGISYDVRASYNSKTTEIGKRKRIWSPRNIFRLGTLSARRQY